MTSKVGYMWVRQGIAVLVHPYIIIIIILKAEF